MRKFLIAGAMVSFLTISTMSVNAQSPDSARYHVHPDQDQVDHDKHHRHHHHHNNENNKILATHKKEVVKYLSNYLNQPEANVNKVVDQHKLEMKKLIFISVVAKLSNTSLENVIAQKEKAKSFQDLLNNNNIKREQFFNEMRKVHKDIFTIIKPNNN
jgi:hypothetical protein